MKLLVIEDDVETLRGLKDGLTANSHIVETAADGKEGVFLARSYDYDVIVLDYSLPGKDGLTVCREVRNSGKTTPILFLSVIDDTEIKITALNSGADDYITKPFSLQELEARLRALSRRPHEVKQTVMQIDTLSLDLQHQTVTRAGEPIHLTRKEFSLLEYFMRHSGVVLSRALLMEHVWTAESDPLSNTVEAHIRNLRKKIRAGGHPNMIANVPGRGYVLDEAETVGKMH